MSEMTAYFWSCVMVCAFVLVPLLIGAIFGKIIEHREDKKYKEELRKAKRFYGRSISNKNL